MRKLDLNAKWNEGLRQMGFASLSPSTGYRDPHSFPSSAWELGAPSSAWRGSQHGKQSFQRRVPKQSLGTRGTTVTLRRGNPVFTAPAVRRLGKLKRPRLLPRWRDCEGIPIPARNRDRRVGWADEGGPAFKRLPQASRWASCRQPDLRPIPARSLARRSKRQRVGQLHFGCEGKLSTSVLGGAAALFIGLAVLVLVVAAPGNSRCSRAGAAPGGRGVPGSEATRSRGRGRVEKGVRPEWH